MEVYLLHFRPKFQKILSILNFDFDGSRPTFAIATLPLGVLPSNV
jgi:hypothetical protein